MDKKLLAMIASIALLCLAFAWPVGYYQLSNWHNQGAPTNGLIRVGVLDDNYAAQASFLVDDLDYGDIVFGVLDADSVSGAGGGLTYFESVPTDSLRWSDTSLDSLTCGVELSRTTQVWFWDVTD